MPQVIEQSLFLFFQGFFSFADFEYEPSGDGRGNVAALVTSPKNPLFLGGGEDPRLEKNWLHCDFGSLFPLEIVHLC